MKKLLKRNSALILLSLVLFSAGCVPKNSSNMTAKNTQTASVSNTLEADVDNINVKDIRTAVVNKFNHNGEKAFGTQLKQNQSKELENMLKSVHWQKLSGSWEPKKSPEIPEYSLELTHSQDKTLVNMCGTYDDYGCIAVFNDIKSFTGTNLYKQRRVLYKVPIKDYFSLTEFIDKNKT